MGLPTNFRNILNLFNIKIAYESRHTADYTVDENASIFMTAVDGVSGNDLITLAELTHFMELVNFPTEMADNLFGSVYNGDADDTTMSMDELTDMFTDLYESNPTGDDNKMDWSEGMNFLSTFSDITLPSTTTFAQYTNFTYGARSIIANYDTNDDGLIDVDEYNTILEAQGVDDGGATAAEIINVYNPGGSALSFDDLISKSIEWDADGDGTIDYADGEAQELVDVLPWQLRPTTSMSTIEQMVRSVVLSNDADKDYQLSADELKTYLVRSAGFPAYMVENMLSLYSGGDDLFSFEELAATYNSFDDGDGELTYEELVDFQNTLTPVQVDTSEISETQYSGLYQIAAKYVISYDGDGDGEVSVKEYRASMNTMESQYAQSGVELPEGYGQHMSENFVRLFDMDKNGSVSVLEIINEYSKIDIDKNGKVTSSEFIDLQERMQDSTLWDNVNAEFITNGDKNYDKELSVTEFQNVLTSKGMPQYIADDAFTLFDLNTDNKLSRLELMEAFSRYDNSAVNTEFYEDLTGEAYTLYNGNSNQILDSNEMLAMFEDMALLDNPALNYAPDTARTVQYEAIVTKSKQMINSYDSYKDGVLSNEELRNYFNDLGLPEYLADSVIATYDQSADGNIDLLEQIQLMLDYDTNQNGTMDLSEEYSLYDDITGIGLNITEANQQQYETLHETVNEFISTYDINNNNTLNQDGTLQTDELEKYFLSKGLPAEYAQLALNAFNYNADGGLDILEWMRAYASVDGDGNGSISTSEELALMDAITGTSLAGISDSVRYSRLEETASTLINTFDVSDNDKKLNETELAAKMKELGLPSYLAAEVIAQYDLNADIALDKMEWMSALADNDANENGILDFDEEIELYSSLSAADVISVSDDEIKQYASLYNYLTNLINTYDDTTDRLLTADELQDYFASFELPAYMAQEMVDLYNLNPAEDTGLDIYELMLPHMAFDINNNGVLEFNEQMGMNAIIADPDLPIDPTTMDAEQVSKLYNYSLNFIKNLDTESNDNRISVSEYTKYLKTQGLSGSVASSVINTQDTNADGYLDHLEWLNTSLQLDINSSGAVDFNELMNLYQSATGVVLNTNDANMIQHQSLYNYTVNTYNTVDSNNDEILSSTELSTWLKDSYAITPDQATQIINTYGGVDGIDALEFTSALINNDINGNGKWDTAEIINFLDDGAGNVVGTIDESNITQYWSFFSYATQQINYYAGADNNMSAIEMRTWLKDYWAMSDNQANQIINTYGGADGMDVQEFTNAIINTDNNGNGNGAWDTAEIMNFLDDGAADSMPEINDSNLTQYWNFYSYAIQQINTFGGADKVMSATEMSSWLKDYWAMSDAQATQLVNSYGGADGMDVQEFTNVIINADNNNNSNGKWDTAEILNFLDDGAGDYLPEISDSNINQYWNLYSYAVQQTNAYGGTDKIMTAIEMRTWLKDAWAMTDDQATQIINTYGGADGMSVQELTNALLNADNAGNANGTWDTAEILNFLDNGSGNRMAEINETNVAQYGDLYSSAIQNINTYGGTDKSISATELRNWLRTTWSISEEQANQIVNTYGGASGIDVQELSSAIINADSAGNANGKWDTAEIINFIDNATGNNITQLDDTNINQYWSLYNSAMSNVKAADANNDQQLSTSEYSAYLRTQGLPQYLADGFVSSAFDTSGNGLINAIELTRLFESADVNSTGSFEFNELLQYYKNISNESAGGYTFGFTPTDENAAQLANAYTNMWNFIYSADTSNDKTVQVTEYRQVLINAGVPAADAAVIAQNAITSFDSTGNGGLDVFEWMDAVLAFDTNSNGVLDGEEVTNFYNYL